MSLDQLINWEKALEQFGFDEHFYKELLGDLRDEMRYQLERMHNCVNQNLSGSHVGYDCETFRCIQQGAHAIKGAAANLMCEPLRQAAARLELSAATASNGREGLTEDLVLMVKQNLNDLHRVAECYNSYFLQLGV